MKLNILILLAFVFWINSCSSKSVDTVPCSKTSAIVSSTNGIANDNQLDFGFGNVTFELDKSLASTVFSNQDDRLREIAENNHKMSCRMFLIQDSKGMDIWTSRHCYFRLAMKEFKFEAYNLDGTLERIDVADTDEKSWNAIQDAIKSIDNKVYGNQKGESFAKRFLFQSFHNLDAYSWIRNQSFVWRSNLLEGLNTDPFPTDPFYPTLLSNLTKENIDSGRDLCSTSLELFTSPGTYQELCFSPGDMMVLRTEDKILQKDSEISNTREYIEWKKEIINLQIEMDNYLLTESLYRGAEYCFKKEKAEDCSITDELEIIASNANELQESNGKHTSKFATFMGANSITSLLGMAAGHRSKVLGAYTNLGTAWQRTSDNVLSSGKELKLSGIFRKGGEKNVLLGSIPLSKFLTSGTTSLSQTQYGLYMKLNSPQVVFETSDSGSVLWAEGFPLASLSTINGKSSSGGASSTGDITVPVADDIIDPRTLEPGYADKQFSPEFWAEFEPVDPDPYQKSSNPELDKTRRETAEKAVKQRDEANNKVPSSSTADPSENNSNSRTENAAKPEQEVIDKQRTNANNEQVAETDC